MLTLTGTDLSVSPLCLGTVNFGTTLADADAHRQLDMFLDRGGSFIDTARVYGDWGDRGPGLSERIIGEWLHKSGNRNRVVISTKGAHPRLDDMGVPRLDGQCIYEDLQQSLSALQTDCIDLYFLHRDDPRLEVEEILSHLEAARARGEIRYYGCSNWRLERIEQARAVALRRGWQGFVCNQLMWSLARVNADRLTDPTLVPMDEAAFSYHKMYGLSAMAYMSVARGYLVKRAAGLPINKGTAELYENERNNALYLRMCQLMPQGYTPLDISLQYFRRQPFPAVPVASFSSSAQLASAMDAMEKPYPHGLMEALTEELQRF